MVRDQGSEAHGLPVALRTRNNQEEEREQNDHRYNWSIAMINLTKPFRHLVSVQGILLSVDMYSICEHEASFMVRKPEYTTMLQRHYFIFSLSLSLSLSLPLLAELFFR